MYYLFISSFKVLDALKLTDLLADIWIVSPVCGFLPVLAALSDFLKVQNPDTATSFPLTNSSLIKLNIASNTLVTSAFINSIIVAIVSIISDC